MGGSTWCQPFSSRNSVNVVICDVPILAMCRYPTLRSPSEKCLEHVEVKVKEGLTHRCNVCSPYLRSRPTSHESLGGRNQKICNRISLEKSSIHCQTIAAQVPSDELLVLWHADVHEARIGNGLRNCAPSGNRQLVRNIGE